MQDRFKTFQNDVSNVSNVSKRFEVFPRLCHARMLRNGRAEARPSNCCKDLVAVLFGGPRFRVAEEQITCMTQPWSATALIFSMLDSAPPHSL